MLLLMFLKEDGEGVGETVGYGPAVVNWVHLVFYNIHIQCHSVFSVTFPAVPETHRKQHIRHILELNQVHLHVWLIFQHKEGLAAAPPALAVRHQPQRYCLTCPYRSSAYQENM